MRKLEGINLPLLLCLLFVYRFRNFVSIHNNILYNNHENGTLKNLEKIILLYSHIPK